MGQEIQQQNPFSAAKQSAATVDAASAREAQEVQAMMVIAKKFPRDPVAATDRILQACARPTLAEGALYSYGRGGADVTGPSIRLAEALAQTWGNLQFGIRELEQRNGESTVEAFAWDLESNTRQVKVFQVPHSRYTKKGSYKLEDPRDIYEMVANQGARRLRACILGVIPGDVIEAAVRQCEVTLTTHADTSPESIKKMIDAFAPFGVTRDQIEKRIQRRLESITPALMVQLKKIYQSLRDGMSSVGDWFEVSPDAVQAEQGSRTDAVKAAIKGRARQAAAPEKNDAPAADFGDSGGNPAPAAREVTYAQIADRLNKAGDIDTIDAFADDIRFIASEDQRVELKQLYLSLRAKMAAE